jgi:hypothetical protein
MKYVIEVIAHYFIIFFVKLKTEIGAVCANKPKPDFIQRYHSISTEMCCIRCLLPCILCMSRVAPTCVRQLDLSYHSGAYSCWNERLVGKGNRYSRRITVIGWVLPVMW